MIKWVFITATMVLAIGCGPKFLVINNLHVLEKGMSRETVAKHMPKEPDLTKPIVYAGKRYETDGYALQTAQSQSRTSSYNATTGVQTTYNTTTDYTNTFICLYDRGKLRYWGLIQDYAKAEDPEIQALSKEVYHMYMTVE